MNIIKGLDRTILVLAIISIVFGFSFGYDEYQKAEIVRIYGGDKPPAGYIYQEPSEFEKMLFSSRFSPTKKYKTYYPPVCYAQTDR